MFVRCMNQSRMVSKAISAAASDLPAASQSKSVEATLAISAESEEYLLSFATVSQIAAKASAIQKFTPIRMPRKVATPLPPRKRSQTGKRWPRKAPRPAISPAWGLRKMAAASSTATVPFSMSPASVAAASFLLPVRSTLVAPILPEPMPRRSGPPVAFVRMIPNGIEPSR